MTTLEICDPPMCCSTGGCGPELDARLRGRYPSRRELATLTGLGLEDGT